MGNRERFEHHASVARNRLELVEEARLADARVARRGEYLPMTGASHFECLLHAVEFAAAAAEFRKSAHRGRLEPCAQRSQSNSLVDFDRFAYASHLHRTERSELEIAGHEADGLAAQDDRTRRRNCLEP